MSKMSLKSFLKEVLGIRRARGDRLLLKSRFINSNQQQSTAINSYNLVKDGPSSPIITNNQQQSTESFNKRDIQYARRVGQIEQMAMDVSDIKEKLTGLDVKFDLRVPDKALTEEKFRKEVSESEDVFGELERIKESISRLENAITNNQQLSPIITTSPEKKEGMNTKEREILRSLAGVKSSADEIGERVGLSRSRANQILLQMQNKGLISRIKYGKKYLWTSNEDSKQVHSH